MNVNNCNLKHKFGMFGSLAKYYYHYGGITNQIPRVTEILFNLRDSGSLEKW